MTTPVTVAIARDTEPPPNNTDDRQCGAVKADGERCNAKPLANSQWCYFHDPDSVEERIAASRRGGEKNRHATLPPDTPDVPLVDANDVGALIGRTVNQVLRGEIDPRIATTVGYLVTIKIRAADQAKLEQRIAALEALRNSD